jgi:hypothetical protein
MASNPHRSPQLLHRLPIIGLFLLAALLMGGCRSREKAPTEPTPLNAVPPEWTVIEVKESGRFSFFSSPSPWQSINIDDDDDVEFLLLYTYDNSAEGKFDGPVGGAIFDGQSTSAFAIGRPPLPLPLQPTGGYIPYRLLPSYVSGQQGAFIGPPSRNAETSTPIRIFQVQRKSAPQQEAESNGQEVSPVDNSANADENADANKNDELVLTDSKTVLTFAWWRNEFDGYGVTQVRGPAGFRNINGEDSLSKWIENPIAIADLDALYPLYGALDKTARPPDVDYADPARANLCRTFHYKRGPAGERPSGVGGQVYRSDIQFNASNLGIEFCGPTPVHPFYPEGVVVKYLRATDRKDQQALLWAGLSEQDQSSILKKTYFDPAKERIEHIETRTNIDYPEDYRTVRSPFLVDARHLMTQVCAKVEPLNDGGGGSRLLYFSLLHSRPNIDVTKPMTATTTSDEEHASDRLWIAYMDDASDWGAANCAELIALDNKSDPGE